MSSADLVSLEETDIQNTIENPDEQKQKKRVSTDGYFLLMQVVFLGGLSGLIAYCVYYGNLLRFTRGYDNYKNICGIQNFIQDDLRKSNAEGSDMRFRPFLLIFRPDGRNSYNATYMRIPLLDRALPAVLSRNVERVCVLNCKIYPNYEVYKNRCILKKRKTVADRFFGKSGIPSFFEEVAQDIELCWQEIVYLGIGAAALSFAIITFFTFFAEVMIWVVLGSTVILCSAFASYMWFLWVKTKRILDQPDRLPEEIELERYRSYLSFALISTFTISFLIVVIWSKRNKLQRIIPLYKEAIKAIGAMRFLFLQPILACIFVLAIISLWIYSALWVETSGLIKRVRTDFFIYEKDILIMITRWYSFAALLWLIRFILDCQHMVVAGAVSFWYFCRNKSALGIPVFYGFYNLVRYHLGSVSLGSLRTFMQIPRAILKLTQKYFTTQQENGSTRCCSCCKSWYENVLKFFVKTAYVEVVIYGYAFRRAGRQVFKILAASSLHITSINNTNAFVLLFMKVLVSTATALAAAINFQKEEALLHIWTLIMLLGFFSYVITDCFCTLYQSTIDTILVCFCEDCKHHNELSEPYTSKELKEFIEESTELFATPTHQLRNKPQAW